MNLKLISKQIGAAIIGVLLVGCSSAKEVESWRTPATENLKLNKVLVFGMTPDFKIRKVFEENLTRDLIKNGVTATTSLAFFDEVLETIPQTMEAWMPFEEKLLSEGFDSVIVARVVEVEEENSKSIIASHYMNFFSTFKDDAVTNPELIKNNEMKNYVINHVLATLYCICEITDESNAVWKTSMKIKQPVYDENFIQEAVRIFSKKFIKELKVQNLFTLK
jgi:hypothetical protein